MMNNAFHEEKMRVTSIPYRSGKLVIFSGVPPLAKHSYNMSGCMEVLLCTQHFCQKISKCHSI
ncbi:hypothetical protein FCV62_19700 [Vibrio kanaloae]|uniref:Uncharacterized protein n=1 Tax=Vibrio kanaloae TaxID=170673 RepID=A0A4U2CIN5_9VIBR|nr:hypothetical protein FCV50_04185 [Vibrio kanaloae]TKF75643.1 hypothetical protein FCV62_19700 [Vibrio kanaloae]